MQGLQVKKTPKKVSREKQFSLLRPKIDVVAQQIARLNKTVLHHQEKLRESEDALSTKQSEHAQLQEEFRDLTDKGFTPTPSPAQTPPRSDHGGEEEEACAEDCAPDVPKEPTSSGSGVAGDAARPIAGTAKKRRCLGSADVLSEVVERERSSQSPRRMRYTSKPCLHNVLNRQKLQKKELLRFFGCKKKRLMQGLCASGIPRVTLVMKGGCWSRKRKNVFTRDLKVFEPFSSQQLIGAVASFKVSSRSDLQHEQESFNSRVVPASSRSGLGGIASAGFNNFDYGVETVLAPGRSAVFRGAHRVCSGGSEIEHMIAGETEGIIGLREVCESDSTKAEVRESALRMRPGAVVASATAGECEGIFGLRSSVETHSCHNSSWGVDVVACARVSAVPGVSATASSSACAPASLAGVAHERSSPMHDAHNSWSDTAMNSLRVQRSTSYNLQGVVPPNSRRKVRQGCTVGSRYAEQTVDMSPAPTAGTYRRSAGTVHDQRQVPRKRSGRKLWCRCWSRSWSRW